MDQHAMRQHVPLSSDAFSQVFSPKSPGRRKRISDKAMKNPNAKQTGTTKEVEGIITNSSSIGATDTLVI